MYKNLKKRYVKALAKNIKKARKQARITPKELARILKKRTRYVVLVERARFDLRIDKIFKIQEALDVDLARLLDFSRIKR